MTEQIRLSPDIILVRKEISLQVEHQRSITKPEDLILSSHMRSFEAFNAMDQSPKFINFIHQMRNLSYCPPEEWEMFRIAVKGRFNELAAEDLLRGKTLQWGTLLDSAHSRHILERLYPRAKIKNHSEGGYDFESSSIRQGDRHLPSPDFILITQGLLTFFAETSYSTNKKYWKKKLKRNHQTIYEFLGRRAFQELFSTTHCNLVMTSCTYQDRKNLLASNRRLSLTKLPYSREEYDEYFDSKFPNSPPHQFYNSETDPKHWSNFLDAAGLREEFAEV